MKKEKYVKPECHRIELRSEENIAVCSKEWVGVDNNGVGTGMRNPCYKSVGS